MEICSWGAKEPVVALEAQVQVVAGDAGDGLGLDRLEDADAMVLMDDEVAGRQIAETHDGPVSDGQLLTAGGAVRTDERPLAADRQLQLPADKPIGVSATTR